MSDTDALLRASIRERRRLALIFTSLLVVVTVSLGAGWVTSAISRDLWTSQAMEWQDRYIELYDEFTVTTGEEPDSPEPADVAEQSPEAIPGAPGPIGPVGASGKDGKDGTPGPAGKSITTEQIAAAVAAYCTDGRCVGPAGTNGINGTNGADGQDSTVPGPAGVDGADGATGPPGPAGPACADGSTPTPVWIPIVVEPDGTPETRQAIVCLKNEGEAP